MIEDFQKIASSTPNNAAAWTCLSWLQLLCDSPQEALRSARYAVKLNGQDPQSRINLSLALLETNSKGVRDHIDYVKRAMLVLPELEKELKELGSQGWEMIFYGKEQESIFKREIEVKTSKNLEILNDQFSDEINLENLKKDQ